jgi:hypothetical protein
LFLALSLLKPNLFTHLLNRKSGIAELSAKRRIDSSGIYKLTPFPIAVNLSHGLIEKLDKKVSPREAGQALLLN